MEKEDAVILGAGAFPRHPIPLRHLRGADKVVCCDGAAREYIERERRIPWRIVGDGDSIDEDTKRRYHGILRLFDEQENNDQTKSTLYLMRHGVRNIAYVGMTGRREDHTIGNVALLVDYMRMRLSVRMYTDEGVFFPVHDTLTKEMLPEEVRESQTISLFSFGATGMKSNGLMYPLHELNSWWQGTLNKVVSADFSVTAKGDFLVYMPYLQQGAR